MCERRERVCGKEGGEVASSVHEERNATRDGGYEGAIAHFDDTGADAEERNASEEIMKRVAELIDDKCIRCILEFRDDNSICSHCFSQGRNYSAWQKLEQFKRETGYELCFENGQYVLRKC